MGTRLNLLSNTDIIVKGDWCRTLLGKDTNGQWCRVERTMPFWIGTTVGTYNKKMEEFNEWEFVRGKLPSSHVHKDAEAPDYKASDFRDLEDIS